jgi:galactose-1-phosphate uridylyltransferase
MLKRSLGTNMPIEYELRDGALVWIRNPFTGVISYVVDLRDKSFAFTLGIRELGPEPVTTPSGRDQMERARVTCPFCPGNESKAPSELIRIGAEEIAGWDGDPATPWVIRIFNNLFPRIPAELTGGRNESYILVEDPRHFRPGARIPGDLLFTGMLGEPHFIRLLQASAEVVARAFSNPAVQSVVVRKNQGRESGASQPHVHQQIIASPVCLPAIDAELRAMQADPALWEELIALVARMDLIVDREPRLVSYATPIGAFPRSYDVVMPAYRGLLHQLDAEGLRAFARAIHRILKFLGPVPLDYEIHHAEGLPLHAHINVRRFPYSNVAGTLNLPQGMLDNVEGIRRALAGGVGTTREP